MCCRFQDEEIILLIKLMIIYPPATAEGVRFASIAVCMLFACPSLISQPEYETMCIQWLKKLSAGDSLFFGKYVERFGIYDPFPPRYLRIPNEDPWQNRF